MTTRFRLYSFWRSTASWRVRIALHYKEIPFDYRAVNLLAGEHRTDAYRAISPLQQVPVLEVDDVRLSQSVAIIEYLEQRFPTPPLLPVEPVERARVRSIVEMINAGIQPLQNSGVQRYVDDELGCDGRAWVRHWVQRGMCALEATVARSAGTFCVGDQVSMADVFLVPEVFFCRRFDIALEPCPTLVRIDARCAELGAFQAAHAQAQPDAPSPS